MKTEQLKEQGLTDEQIAFVMKENGKDVAKAQKEVESITSDRDAWKAKAEQAEEALKSFDGIEPEKLQEEIQKYKDEAEQLKKEYEEKEANRIFEDAVKEVIGEAKGRNEKAILALLDIDTLKKSKNQKEDIKKAIDDLKEAEDSSFLFVDEKQQKAEQNKAMFTTATGKQSGPGQLTKEDFKSMSIDERIKLKQESPELYNSLRN